jgi:hypothetical protein
LKPDVKEVIGLLMRLTSGAEVSREELRDIAFEADGDLETLLNESYVKLCEFANDRQLRRDDPGLDQDMRREFEILLSRIVSVYDAVS